MSTRFPNLFANQNLSTMYLESELADVHFTFPNDNNNRGGTVAAHKLILASASPVFKAMFYGPLRESDTVKITDSTADAFMEFLQLFYLPEVTLTIGHIDDVVRLADKYDILDHILIDSYQKSIENQLTNENMVCGYQLAISLDDPALKQFCERRIRIFTMDVLKSEAFLNCKREVLEHILHLDTLECTEIGLFDACVAWAKSACQKNGLDENDSVNLKTQLGPCFYLIRFGAMQADDIGNILLSKLVEGLFTSVELAELWRLTMKKQSNSDLFKHLPRLSLLETLLDANHLLCIRSCASSLDTRACKIESQESTFFTSTELIILKRIHFGAIFFNNFSYILNAELKIFEYHDDYSHVIHTADICSIGYDCMYEFDAPIVINPLRRYEICLLISNNVDVYFHYLTYESHVTLDEKTIVEFSYNPQNLNPLRRGMVSKLDFYRI